MNSINNLLSNFDVFLDKTAHYYVYIIIIIHILYLFLFAGLLSMNQVYLREFNILIQIFVCVFLIIRFFPMRKHTLRENDPHIIFGSATFLLMNLGFIEVVSKYLPTSISNKIKS